MALSLGGLPYFYISELDKRDALNFRYTQVHTMFNPDGLLLPALSNSSDSLDLRFNKNRNPNVTE